MKKSIYSLSLFLAGLFLIGQQVLAQNPDPEVTVIQPDKKNIEWVIGETYLISWTDNFINTVDIYLVDYSTNVNGDDILIDEDIEGSTYAWFIDPDDFVAGDNYKVRVQSSVNPIYEDDSKWEFSLVTSASNAFIKVEQPNVKNIEWIRGYEYLISWTDNIEGPMDIFLVYDDTYNPGNEATWSEIETAVEGSTYSWTIPANTDLRDDYRILVTDADREEKDLSDKTFSIVESGGTIKVLQPNVKNIEWIYGNEYLISWNKTTTGTFDLYLITEYSAWDDDSPFTTGGLIEIETDVEGTTYSWEIDDAAIEALVPGTEFRIMVRATDSDIYDISDKDFSIVAYSGFIKVEQPNVKNISWILGTDHLISWLDNIDSDMDIFLVNDEEYDVNDELTWGNRVLIEDDVPGTTYTWEIDPNLEARDDYRILIATPDFSIRDLSDKTFSLVENDGEIDVIQPDVKGIKWVIGNEYLISWTSSAMGTVDIDLYSDAGSVIAEDKDDNYHPTTVDVFEDGANEGTGFGAWEITESGLGTQEAAVDAPPVAITGMDDPSFYIVGYGDASSSITAKRPFDEPMKVLDVFSLDWGVFYRNGNKGFKLLSGSDVLIDISLQSTVEILITHDGVTEVMFADAGNYHVMPISFELISPTQLKVSGTGRNSAETFEETYTIDGAPDAVEFYSVGHSATDFIFRANWFNNLKITSKYVDNIVEDVENSTYTWEIDDNIAPRDDYRVKISAHEGDFIYDFSRKPFEIALSGGGNLSFNQPSTGDLWYKGFAYWIIWEDDIMEPLDIYLKNVAGTVSRTIDTDFEGSMIDYTVPTNNTVPVGNDYYIQIVSTLDPSMVFNSGVFEISEPIMAGIFPNPASQYFNVQLDEQVEGIFEVVIYDRFNNRMLETRLDAATKHHRISTANLPDGFYFVQMVNGDKTFTKKIIVKH